MNRKGKWTGRDGLKGECAAEEKTMTAKQGFPPGARVLIDGEYQAIVRAYYPEGSTSYAFAHYKLDVVDGDRNIAVAEGRVGVDRKPKSRP